MGFFAKQRTKGMEKKKNKEFLPLRKGSKPSIPMFSFRRSFKPDQLLSLLNPHIARAAQSSCIS